MTTYVVTSDVDFRQSEEAVSFRTGLDDFFECQIHPVITLDQMSVQGLSILQLDQHRVALSGRQ